MNVQGVVMAPLVPHFGLFFEQVLGSGLCSQAWTLAAGRRMPATRGSLKQQLPALEPQLVQLRL